MKTENLKYEFLRIFKVNSEGKNAQKVRFISDESRLSHEENDAKWLEIEWGLFLQLIQPVQGQNYEFDTQRLAHTASERWFSPV